MKKAIAILAAVAAVVALADICRSGAPRTFSKLRIVAALTKAGVWAQVKAYIEQAELYDLYLAAQDFAEDNEYFAQGKVQLQTALGWTDEQVEALLARSVKEGN